MKKIFVVGLLICFVIGAMSQMAVAQQKAQERGDTVKTTAGNLVLGWTEIPKSIVEVTKDTDNPFLGITAGLLKGIANAFSRTTAGVADVVTLRRSEPLNPIMIPSDSDTSQTK
ncbi:MAG: exosortase system-associated protein, TIGR04073 family [Candidatus Omnitrophica bacterium]|nr:exosortase system-associated protein, TIGR04073 family [Candidatus Omnitrophota bacterium]